MHNILIYKREKPKDHKIILPHFSPILDKDVMLPALSEKPSSSGGKIA